MTAINHPSSSSPFHPNKLGNKKKVRRFSFYRKSARDQAFGSFPCCVCEKLPCYFVVSFEAVPDDAFTKEEQIANFGYYYEDELSSEYYTTEFYEICSEDCANLLRLRFNV